MRRASERKQHRHVQSSPRYKSVTPLSLLLILFLLQITPSLGEADSVRPATNVSLLLSAATTRQNLSTQDGKTCLGVRCAFLFAFRGKVGRPERQEQLAIGRSGVGASWSSENPAEGAQSVTRPQALRQRVSASEIAGTPPPFHTPLFSHRPPLLIGIA